MWFQANAMNTWLERNVHFNGPRAGLNFNDAMGGGDIIEGNLHPIGVAPLHDAKPGYSTLILVRRVPYSDAAIVGRH